MHAGKDGHADIDVVVDLDPRLAIDRAEYAADVLDETTLEGERRPSAHDATGQARMVANSLGR